MRSPLPRQQQPASPGGAPDATAGEAKADGIERRRHPRIRVDGSDAETAASAIRAVDRRQNGDRRAAGSLRDNVGWTVAADRGNRSGGSPRLRLKRQRIVVLGIAMVAGGFAAFLASQVGRPQAPVAVAAAPVATSRVLIASRHIAAGERLSSAALAWAPWPGPALQPDYITAAATPAAVDDMAGQLARSEFLPGDPIRKEKLTDAAGGFLSATLGQGMRGVSVMVTAESASGGFIGPNDRVDVVLTRTPTGGLADSTPRTETILRNVRMLAINSNAANPGSGGPAPDEQHGHTFSGQAIATLALTPTAADLLVSAAATGKLSLLLRPMEASDAARTTEAADSLNQAIRLSSPFWQK